MPLKFFNVILGDEVEAFMIRPEKSRFESKLMFKYLSGAIKTSLNASFDCLKSNWSNDVKLEHTSWNVNSFM